MLIQYVVRHVGGLGLVVLVHIRVSHAQELTLFSVPYCIQRQIGVWRKCHNIQLINARILRCASGLMANFLS